MNLYASLGYFCNYISGLEFVIDRFIFAYSKLASPLTKRTPNFPMKMISRKQGEIGKIDFLVLAYLEHSPLRACGDADDRIDLNGLAFSIEEIWMARNHLIHGRIDVSHHDDGHFYFRSSRYVRVEKNRYQIVTSETDRTRIVMLLERASYIQAMLTQGLEILDGKNPRLNKSEMRRNHAALRQAFRRAEEQGQMIKGNPAIKAILGLNP